MPTTQRFGCGEQTAEAAGMAKLLMLAHGKRPAHAAMTSRELRRRRARIDRRDQRKTVRGFSDA